MAAQLRLAILEGTISPGEWLRQEEIAARLGASRLPVREALRMLEADGPVVIESNRGARVRWLGSRKVALFYQMRERREPLALAESLCRLDPDDLDCLQDIQCAMETWPRVAHFLRLGSQFHLLTYSRCDMEPLWSTVTGLWSLTQHYRRVYMTLGGAGRNWIVSAAHHLVLHALQRGSDRCGPVPAGPHRPEPGSAVAPRGDLRAGDQCQPLISPTCRQGRAEAEGVLSRRLRRLKLDPAYRLVTGGEEAVYTSHPGPHHVARTERHVLAVEDGLGRSTQEDIGLLEGMVVLVPRSAGRELDHEQVHLLGAEGPVDEHLQADAGDVSAAVAVHLQLGRRGKLVLGKAPDLPA